MLILKKSHPGFISACYFLHPGRFRGLYNGFKREVDSGRNFCLIIHVCLFCYCINYTIYRFVLIFFLNKKNILFIQKNSINLFENWIWSVLFRVNGALHYLFWSHYLPADKTHGSYVKNVGRPLLGLQGIHAENLVGFTYMKWKFFMLLPWRLTRGRPTSFWVYLV